MDVGPVAVLLATIADARAASDAVRQLRPAGTAAFIGLLSDDLEDEVGPILARLRPVLAEVVFFDAITSPFRDRSGSALAMRALDEFGFGQDFVFTVPALLDAVDYALDVLSGDDRHHWEGQQLLVVGPLAVIDAARRHLLSRN